MCDKVAVMYAGKIVEQGSVREIYYHPRHPYTDGLLKSVPRVGSKDPLYIIRGQPPDLANSPSGCAFAPSCAYATVRCLAEEPEEYAVASGHTSRCWLAVQEGQRRQRFPGRP
jgi:oligopeptide/dipeptide ABC transporter ATP-binding protein